MNKEFYNVVILIPSYQPDEKLTKYVNELIDNKFRKILIVNDGSDEKCNKIFDELKNKEECIVLEHKENIGKGKALKTGFEYYINNIDRTEFVGIVTADSDGQHSVKDTIKIAESIDKNKDNKYYGIYQYKIGFGGNIIEYPERMLLIIDKNKYLKYSQICNLKRRSITM